MTLSYTTSLNNSFITTGIFTGSQPGNQLLVNNLSFEYNNSSTVYELDNDTINVGTFTLTTTYNTHFFLPDYVMFEIIYFTNYSNVTNTSYNYELTFTATELLYKAPYISVTSARVVTASYELQTYDLTLTLLRAGPPADLTSMHQANVYFSSSTSSITYSSYTGNDVATTGYTPVKSGFTDAVLLFYDDMTYGIPSMELGVIRVNVYIPLNSSNDPFVSEIAFRDYKYTGESIVDMALLPSSHTVYFSSFHDENISFYLSSESSYLMYNSSTNRLTTNSSDERLYVDFIDKPGVRGNGDGYRGIRKHGTEQYLRYDTTTNELYFDDWTAYDYIFSFKLFEYFNSYFLFHYNNKYMSYNTTDQIMKVIPSNQTSDVLSMSAGKTIVPTMYSQYPPGF